MIDRSFCVLTISCSVFSDAKHPYGYGRAAFFWSLVSALGKSPVVLKDKRTPHHHCYGRHLLAWRRHGHVSWSVRTDVGPRAASSLPEQ